MEARYEQQEAALIRRGSPRKRATSLAAFFCVPCVRLYATWYETGGARHVHLYRVGDDAGATMDDYHVPQALTAHFTSIRTQLLKPPRRRLSLAQTQATSALALAENAAPIDTSRKRKAVELARGGVGIDDVAHRPQEEETAPGRPGRLRQRGRRSLSRAKLYGIFFFMGHRSCIYIALHRLTLTPTLYSSA